jgi:thiol-disulfide isomerase/thioredoxin
MFVIAAGGKLADLQSSRDTVVAFGLPARLASIGGTALPFAELATAIALLPTASARWGSVAAVLLLAVFTAGVAYALSQGRTPDCNCFGVVSSEQISNRTLLRNGALILLAALSIWRAPGSSISGWTSNLDAANLVAVISVLALALAGVALAQARHALTAIRFDLISLRARNAKPGLQPGDAAPDFNLPILGVGGTQSFEDLRRRGTPALLVFASQSCAPCLQMLPDLVKWSETVEERLSIVLVESAVEDPDDLAAHINQHGRILTLLDQDRSMADAYSVTATPTAVLVGADGTIAAPQAQGAGNIEGLLRTGLESHTASIAA